MLNREKLKQVKNSFKGSNSILWKPEEGKQTIRMVPYAHQPDWPFIEIYFHYKIAKRPLISPQTFNRPDPIMQFHEHLLEQASTKEEKKAAYKFKPKKRIYAPIIVRGLEKEGVKFYGFSKTIYEELVMKLDNPKWGIIYHPTDGRDIDITYTLPTKPGEFAKTHLDVDPNITVATTDESVLKSIKEAPNLLEVGIWKEKSYDELAAILEEYHRLGGQQVDPSTLGNFHDSADNDVKEAVNTGTTAVSTESKPPTPPQGTNTGHTPQDQPPQEGSKEDVMAAFGKWFDKDKGGDNA